jgi:hypothetical protein
MDSVTGAAAFLGFGTGGKVSEEEVFSILRICLVRGTLEGCKPDDG